MKFTNFSLSGCLNSKDTVLIQATYVVYNMPIHSPLGMDIAKGVLKLNNNFKRNEENEVTHSVSANGYDKFYAKCQDVKGKWEIAKAKVDNHLKMHKALGV